MKQRKYNNEIKELRTLGKDYAELVSRKSVHAWLPWREETKEMSVENFHNQKQREQKENSNRTKWWRGNKIWTLEEKEN